MTIAMLVCVMSCSRELQWVPGCHVFPWVCPAGPWMPCITSCEWTVTLPNLSHQGSQSQVDAQCEQKPSSVCRDTQSQWKPLVSWSQARQDANKNAKYPKSGCHIQQSYEMLWDINRFALDGFLSVSVSGVQWSWRPLREWQSRRTASTPLSTGLYLDNSEHFPYRKYPFSSQNPPEKQHKFGCPLLITSIKTKSEKVFQLRAPHFLLFIY